MGFSRKATDFASISVATSLVLFDALQAGASRLLGTSGHEELESLGHV